MSNVTSSGGAASAGGSATVIVGQRVKRGRADDFEHWQSSVNSAAATFAGFLATEVTRPVDEASDWTTVSRFASAEDLDRWLDSPERKALLARGDKFHNFDLRRVSNSFGSWLSFGGDGGVTVTPPSWKTALSVLVGLYPTVVLFTLGIRKLWPDAELWESLLLGNVLSVCLLTWVVMPVVTRALRFWLTPTPSAPEPRTDVIGAVASVGFLTLAALVFWLVTVQFWTLP